MGEEKDSIGRTIRSRLDSLSEACLSALFENMLMAAPFPCL
jgi:hypothetical protein